MDTIDKRYLGSVLSSKLHVEYNSIRNCDKAALFCDVTHLTIELNEQSTNQCNGPTVYSQQTTVIYL